MRRAITIATVLAAVVFSAIPVLGQSARSACESAARALARQQTSWEDSGRGSGGDTLRWRAANGTRGLCRVDDRGRVYDVRVESWAPDDDFEVWPDGSGDLTEEIDFDRRGNDYRNFRASSLARCQDACRSEGRCRAYTFRSRDGLCWLKDRANDRQFDRDMVTGYKTGNGGGSGGGGRLTEERGEDRRGSDYADFRADGLRDCQDACQRDPRCRAYTYDTRSRGCYLKSQVPQAQRNSQMVSGYKR
jgi:hypothetical protein